jgi:fructosamine-3-kinase
MNGQIVAVALCSESGSDPYFSRVVQQNPWTASGHEFFAQHRVLCYLDEPLVQKELTHADRRALERFCDRLPELIPVMPAVLTHGDLWAGNLLSRDDVRITAIDPAVSCTWAEVDLSMLWGCQRSLRPSTSSASARNSTPRCPTGASGCRSSTYGS